MKQILSEEEFGKVKSFLDCQNIKYWDVKAELLDHLVCDIENMIPKEGVGFDIAFESAKKNILNSFSCASFYDLVTVLQKNIFRNNRKLSVKKMFSQTNLLLLFLLLEAHVALSFAFSWPAIYKFSLVFVVFLCLSKMLWELIYYKIFYRSAIGMTSVNTVTLGLVNMLVFIPIVFTGQSFSELVPPYVLIFILCFMYVFIKEEIKVTLALYSRTKDLRISI